MNARSPELAKHQCAVEQGNQLDREWIADERLAKASSQAAPERPLELLVTDLPASFSVVAGRFLGGDASQVTEGYVVAR